jgi:hypothetical protein
VVWVVSLQVLLASYLLAGQGPTLVRLNLTDRVTARMGSLLLEPAFQNPVLVAQGEGEIVKSALRTALSSSSEMDYRARLESFLRDPSELAGGPPDESAAPADASPPAGSGAPARGSDPEELLVQIGLRWVTSPHRTWLSPLRPGTEADGKPEGEESPFFLPEFLLTLISELPPDASLSRGNWEHVAGTRYVDGVLQPLMEEYLSYFALFLACLVVLGNAVFFLLMRRARRIGMPGAGGKGKDAAAAKSAAPAPKAQQAAPPAVAPAAPAESPPAVPAGSAAPSAAESREQAEGEKEEQPA